MKWIRSAAAAIALIGVALLSAGCIKVDISIHMNSDGSGTVSFLTAVDSTLTDALSTSFGGSSGSNSSATDITSIDTSKLPPGATVTPYSEGKFKGQQVTAPFKSGDDVGALIEQIAASGRSSSDASTGGTDSAFDPFSLKGSGDTWTFDATVKPPNDGQDASSLGLTPEQLKVLFKDASFTVRLKLPGSVFESNADTNKGGELTWNLDIFATKPRSLSARSHPDTGNGFPVLPVVAIAGVAIAAATVVLLVRRRSGDTL